MRHEISTELKEHRLLQHHGLSQLTGSASLPEEKRSFGAEFGGSICYGDVMNGPHVPIKGQLRKTYLVSLLDDASRLVAHSAFCLGETALDIEGVLKQPSCNSRPHCRSSRSRNERLLCGISIRFRTAAGHFDPHGAIAGARD